MAVTHTDPGGGRSHRDDEILAVLLARQAEFEAEVTELTEPVRAPGVQIQFGKRAGDHTSDAVLQMTRSVAASRLHQLLVEVERALEKLADGSYGECDDCAGHIPEERLQALPWAVRCAACSAPAKVSLLRAVQDARD